MKWWRKVFGRAETIEEAEPASAPASDSRGDPAAANAVALGIGKLAKMISEPLLVFDPDKEVREVVQHLRAAGPSGTRALIGLLDETLQCRTRAIGFAILVAQELQSTPDLIEVLRKIASAPYLAQQPGAARFRGEMEGEGKVGWTGGTHANVQRRANEALTTLTATSRPS